MTDNEQILLAAWLVSVVALTWFLPPFVQDCTSEPEAASVVSVAPVQQHPGTNEQEMSDLFNRPVLGKPRLAGSLSVTQDTGIDIENEGTGNDVVAGTGPKWEDYPICNEDGTCDENPGESSCSCRFLRETP